jgi:polyisoprenoid-binding protein YceI
VIWMIDPEHLQVEFTSKHLDTMTVRGHFTEVQVSGTIDPGHPENSSVTVTIPATLKVLRYGDINDPGMMGHRIAYSAETEIDRRDFGLTFNALLDGRWAVGDRVAIKIELELVEQEEAEPATAASS